MASKPVSLLTYVDVLPGFSKGSRLEGALRSDHGCRPRPSPTQPSYGLRDHQTERTASSARIGLVPFHVLRIETRSIDAPVAGWQLMADGTVGADSGNISSRLPVDAEFFSRDVEAHERVNQRINRR